MDNNGKPFDKKDSSIWEATKELIAYEFGDKTFLIVLIFTLGWSNPLKFRRGNVDRPGYAVFADGRTIINHRLTYVAPTRIFNLATIGTLYMSWNMSGKTEPNQVNNWVFKSAGILVFILLNYAFRLASVHYSAVTKLQVEYETSRLEQSKHREDDIRDWSVAELEVSKQFTDSHKKMVFMEFNKNNEKLYKDLHKLSNEILLDSKKKMMEDTSDIYIEEK